LGQTNKEAGRVSPGSGTVPAADRGGADDQDLAELAAPVTVADRSDPAPPRVVNEAAAVQDIAWQAKLDRSEETAGQLYKLAEAAQAAIDVLRAKLANAEAEIDRLGRGRIAVAEELRRQANEHEALEFAAQWRNVSGIAVDWLPTMRVGDAGDRIDGMLRAKPGHKGHIVYGPYFQLPPGAYHVCALLDSGQSWRSRYRREPVATLEAVANEGNAYLAQRDITPEDLRRGRHEFTFAVTEAAATRGQNIVEVRLWTSGAVPFSVSSITVERLPL